MSDISDNLVVWTPDMSVGVSILDEDHKRIMKLINKLHAAILEGQARKILGEIFHELTIYINIHFESEESLLAHTDYPETEDQKKSHHDMREKMLAIKDRFEQNPESVQPVEILRFLKDWWVEHIMTSDRKYTAHLNARGIR